MEAQLTGAGVFLVGFQTQVHQDVIMVDGLHVLHEEHDIIRLKPDHFTLAAENMQVIGTANE
jgi:hypothetical protein